MTKDMTLITHRFDEPIIIYPIADVHLGAVEHNAKAWEAVCKEILDQPNAYVILDGDLLDNATRSSIGDIWAATMNPMEARIKMCEQLMPIKERILCIVSGNHELRTTKDSSEDESLLIATKLNLEEYWRQNVAFMTLRFGKRNGETNAGKPMVSYNFCVTHGSGGTLTAAANKSTSFGNVIDNLDVLIVGHSHKGFVIRPSKLVIDNHNNKVTQRDYVVVSAVSWMEYGGYATRKMLTPSSHSNPQKIFLGMPPSREKDIQVIW